MTLALRYPEKWKQDEPTGWLLSTGRTERADWSRPAAFVHAADELNLLEHQLVSLGQEVPSALAKVRFLSVLRDVLAADSVYPSVSLDADGSLIAEWRAGPRRIDIEVSAEGEETFTVRTRGQQPSYVGPSIARLRRHLRDLSTTTNAQNPRWRSLF